MIELALTSLLVVASVVYVVTIIKLRNKINKLNKDLVEQKDNSNASYQKFLFDSRTWAFQYIEEAQKEIANFIKAVDPKLEYYNTYGRVIVGPHIDLLDTIYPAYVELKKLLPQETNKEKQNNE
jgi:hypothetical protein